MQFNVRTLSMIAFALACSSPAIASAHATKVTHSFPSHSDHGFSGPSASFWDGWWGHKDHPSGGGGDCKVPEISGSGLPSMAVVVLGGVAILRARRGRRND